MKNELPNDQNESSNIWMKAIFFGIALVIVYFLNSGLS